MNSNERRQHILQILTEGGVAVSGKELSARLGVSRQVIVQDIALLRANGADIISTSNGYLVQGQAYASRVFKVQHSDSQVEEELLLMVDYGGTVQDVFVYHKIYGVIRAEMNIRSRLDVQNFMDGLKTGTSSLLKNITAEYHYHTVQASSEAVLDIIQEKLRERGFLAQLRDYEPVDFWNQ